MTSLQTDRDLISFVLIVASFAIFFMPVLVVWGAYIVHAPAAALVSAVSYMLTVTPLVSVIRALFYMYTPLSFGVSYKDLQVVLHWQRASPSSPATSTPCCLNSLLLSRRSGACPC